MRRAAGEIETVLAENERFHFALIEIASMPVLARLVESLWMQCGPTLRLCYLAPSGQQPGSHAHLAVMEALRCRNPRSARAALVRDLQENGQRISMQLKKTAPASLSRRRNSHS